jgi:hypothetical protein
VETTAAHLDVLVYDLCPLQPLVLRNPDQLPYRPKVNQGFLETHYRLLCQDLTENETRTTILVRSWWLTPVIPATWEAETGTTEVAG